MITHYVINPTVSLDSALLDATSLVVPKRVFTSTSNGFSTGTPQTSAVTTIALCNTGPGDLEDELVDQVIVNIYLVRQGKTFQPGDLIVSNLIVPAGETVFFSEERLILDPGDQIWIGAESTAIDPLIAVTVSSLPV
jgi:hypothetical protein